MVLVTIFRTNEMKTKAAVRQPYNSARVSSPHSHVTLYMSEQICSTEFMYICCKNDIHSS